VNGDGGWHTSPPAALWQSLAVLQPQACFDVSHTGPLPLSAQSAFVTQPTHWPVATLQTGPDELLVQSVLPVQLFVHWVPLRKFMVAGQLKPAAHPVAAVQPHCFVGRRPWTNGTEHTLPPLALAQSPSTLQPHTCSAVLQSGPSALPAQSALVTQPVTIAASPPPSLPLPLPASVAGLLLQPLAAKIINVKNAKWMSACRIAVPS
jgi:hypothetical protein